MKLENEFTVDAPVDEAWNVMLDLERVTPCLPGAQLTEQVGDGEHKGEMKVRLGPVTQQYNGTVSIEEADESEHRAVLKANGKDARGQGTASATITSTLHEENGGESTRVRVETDMQITGRAAQFGQGVQQDVAEKIMSRFAECLENEILGGGAEEETEPSTDGAAEEAEQPQGETAQQEEGGEGVEALDLGEASQGAILERVKKAAPVVVPVVAGIVSLVIVIRLLKGSRSGARGEAELRVKF